MNKYADIKVVAYAFQALGLFVFLISLLYMLSTNNYIFMVCGLIGFMWFYAIGGALLVLIDIARSVRASALIALGQDDRRKAKAKVKPSSNGKPLGLKRINPEKKRSA